MAKRKLTDRQARFVDEYLIDLNGKQAAIRSGYSEKAAAHIAVRLLANPLVSAYIAERKADRRERVEVTQDMVLRRLWLIATADPRKVVEYRRTCCRHCYGEGYRFQRTAGELERDRVEHERRLAAGDKVGPFAELGGAGYNRTRAPNKACPECRGEGVGEAFAHDSRGYDEQAAMLYAGVKVTRDGLEIKTHDQDAALDRVARHLGMFKERFEHTGKDGQPLNPPAPPSPVDLSKLSDDELATLAALHAKLANACGDPGGTTPPQGGEGP